MMDDTVDKLKEQILKLRVELATEKAKHLGTLEALRAAEAELEVLLTFVGKL